MNSTFSPSLIEISTNNEFPQTGAGISTSAGIPDFRSPKTGLYSNLARLNLPYPEAVFDISFFKNNPMPFYTLAHELYPGKFRPTIAHSFIRLLSDKGLLLKLFTQNIDCLEREAGVPDDKIIEAHGSFARQRCIDCNAPFPNELMRKMVANKDIPHCFTPQCNGLVKPDIVFFGERLPEEFHRNRSLPSTADLCIIMGTSLSVQPFASLPSFCSEGVPRLLINLEPVGGLGSRADDVLLLGDCDSGIRKFAAALGWSEELEALWKATVPNTDLHNEQDNPSKTKDEELEDEIDLLTGEVDESLKISHDHTAWLRNHLTQKHDIHSESTLEDSTQNSSNSTTLGKEELRSNATSNTRSTSDIKPSSTAGDSSLKHVFHHLSEKPSL